MIRYCVGTTVRSNLQTLTFHSSCFLIKIPVEIIILANIHTIQYKIFVESSKTWPADFCTLFYAGRMLD